MVDELMVGYYNDRMRVEFVKALNNLIKCGVGVTLYKKTIF